ncbi:MAG: aspartate kinase [Candidatus Cryptobacteroides sp.]|nr:aspartate kinase [Candidatus Cryptobacteroides sp.]
MRVLKFGGSSVANATAMSRAMDIVEGEASSDRVLVVSSAISGCTDALIAIGNSPVHERKELVDALRDKHIRIIRRLFSGSSREEAIAECKALSEMLLEAPSDECVTFGELFSTRILYRKFADEGYEALWLDSRKLIVSDDLAASYKAIREALAAHPDARVIVAPGFIASDSTGKVTTLGRGGSDYSAAIFAAALDAGALEIWTDVPGIMTTNPKVVPAARTIGRMSYEAAFTMAEHGAKVLYAPTVVPAREKGIAINIRNTFDPSHPGTVIESASPSGVCRWMGLSSEASQGNVRLNLVAEGPLDSQESLKRVTEALKEAGIAPLDSGSDDSLVWVTVRPEVERQASSALHSEFFEEEKLRSFDVYVAGNGAVGKALASLIESGASVRAGKEVRIIEISSDRNFAAKVLANAQRRSVFVDCTNSEDIWKMYVPLLEAGINIVSSNRRSLAVPYVEYAAMKQAALRSGVFFRYSTTVGNALPILESVAMETSLNYFEAVVSCTMNNIITGYDGANTESFATLLHHAQMRGLTENDPRTDLGGRDALRKLLILAREAGVPLEEEDVTITPLLGKEYFNCSLEDFYSKLELAEPEFIRREAELDEIDKRQRFVASIHKDPSARTGYKAEIKMQLYGISSPFYWISGTQNIVEISSEGTAPLVIKGAGEGAGQAALGILADILR